MTPAVSVLVPAHEHAAFLPRALGSLRDQRFRDWQAIVLDDGSRDSTPEVVRVWTADPRIRGVRWATNRGLGATLNAGLDLADAPVVAYLPADDVWYADHLDAVLEALDDGDVALAWSGIRHHGGVCSLDAPAGFVLQLVQVAHRHVGERWTERPELESDDLELLMWRRLRGRRRTARTGRVTCEWTDHPGQRHKAIRESYDGGLNVFRSRYRVAEPLRFHSTDSGMVDEVARYRRFRARTYEPSPDGLRVLLVGELAFNPERVLALAARGHRLHGLWTPDGLGDATVGPLPFGHVADLPRDGWAAAIRDVAPDVIHAQLNWRAVPFAHAVHRAAPDVPLVWHFKESPQRSIVRGEWPLLADLLAGADSCLLATAEEREWVELALAGRVDPARLGVLDGDLPLAEWLDEAPRSAKLSEADGAPHTVVLGRPVGLDAAAVVALARAGVHVHLYGQVAAPGPKGAWRAWLDDAMTRAAGYLHVHPAIGPESWVRELSQYDAGWLHRVRSDNGGDLRRASWDDLNSPARLPILLAAGLPVLQPANPGSRVAVERVLAPTGAGLLYRDLDDVVDLLRAEVLGGVAGAAAWHVRRAFTHDAHVDRLVEVLRSAAGVGAHG